MSKMFLEIIKYIPEKHIFDVMNFFKENKVNFNFNTLKSSKTLKLNIYNTSLFGGDDNSKNIEINMKNTKFNTKIYEYDDGYLKTINFVKINSIYNEKKDTQEKHFGVFSGAHQKIDINFLGCDFNQDDFCGILIFDKENNNATIQSINSYNDCIKCFDNKTFKVGEILFRIMICICVYKKIKKIHLIDNSYLDCGNDKIPLIYLRTITQGKPYYAKYGFYPINHNKDGENDYYKNELQIYRDNVDTFNINPTIKKNKLIKILNYQKFDEIKDKKMIYYLNNILMPYIDSLKSNDIPIKDFVLFVIDEKKIIHCLLLINILMPLFYKCGYKQYKYRHFEFIMEKKFTDNIKSHIKIKNL